ncbi:MAG: proline--tRNA ligase [Nitrospirae bacterium]|nr:proline--tRNA ligase [Nitrospirota bacterium]MBI3605624.1 proline--tRNA ligase [Nitrospirota bacterium]
MPSYITRYFIPTLRNDPVEAEVISHRLMLRAGMIRKVAAGIYNYLPLGLKVIRKIENIVREEMNRAGSLELLMPAVLPSELWKETKRWDYYGKELLRFKDRHDREFCFGPTHEEVITDLVRNEVRSYRALPLIFYQIQTKFRDEIRPRFGLMRGREFIMKDAYSFDQTVEGARKTYDIMYETYTRIFTRCGLNFRAVEADTGAIGGSSSHEFSVLADSGEDGLVICRKCQYAANIEQAEKREIKKGFEGKTSEKPIEKISTPGKKTVSEVAAFLNIPPQKIIKTLIYLADQKPVTVLLRGDFELNEVKFKKVLNANELLLASAKIVEEVTRAPGGFAGPIGLSFLKIYADEEVRGMDDGVVGGNEKDIHFLHVTPDRDFKVDQYLPLRKVVEGDSCPRCEEGTLGLTRGIEVGHVFMLGTKYSEAMSAKFLNPEGKEENMVMGCFGIGIGRTAAASIEQNHDEKGMIWPVQIAPFHVLILPLNSKSAQIVQMADQIGAELEKSGFEVLIDDRNDRPGVKFNDADLIGIPYQVILGEKNLAEGLVEVKIRKTGENQKVPLGEVPAFLKEHTSHPA